MDERIVQLVEQHAFFDDTRPDRYHPGAAREAWPQTLRFLTRHLKG